MSKLAAILAVVLVACACGPEVEVIYYQDDPDCVIEHVSPRFSRLTCGETSTTIDSGCPDMARALPDSYECECVEGWDMTYDEQTGFSCQPTPG